MFGSGKNDFNCNDYYDYHDYNDYLDYNDYYDYCDYQYIEVVYRGHEGTEMFGSGKNDYNCKSERSASSIRGDVSVLDAFPISFLKAYYQRVAQF